MDMPPLPARRWRLIGGVGIVIVLLLLIVGLFITRHPQRAAQASTAAGVCASGGNAAGATVSTVPVWPPFPPGVTLPVTLPAGEPRIVATVNGDPIYAVGLELEVEATLANQRQVLQQVQQGPPGSLPPNVLASLHRTPNQVRHDALTRLIQDCLLLQEGKRLGLTASLSAAQAMARQQLQLIRSVPASDQGRVSFEAYLHANHLNEQTFLTDPRILHAYVEVLTIAAVKQYIRKGLPPGESPEAGINAYMQHLWQIGTVRVFLPAQLGW